MSTTQSICSTDMWQPEPQRSLVGSTPVEEGQKLSINNLGMQSLKDYTWENLRGGSLTEEEW